MFFLTKHTFASGIECLLRLSLESDIYFPIYATIEEFVQNELAPDIFDGLVHHNQLNIEGEVFHLESEFYTRDWNIHLHEDFETVLQPIESHGQGLLFIKITHVPDQEANAVENESEDDNTSNSSSSLASINGNDELAENGCFHSNDECVADAFQQNHQQVSSNFI